MPRKTSPRLEEVVERYLMTRKTHLAERTYTTQKRVLTLFTSFMGLKKQVHTLEQWECERYFSALRDQVKASSYNTYRSHIGHFTAWMHRQGYTDTDLMGEVRGLKEIKRVRWQLTAEELADLPSHADNARDRAFISTAIHTALRGVDLVELKVSDVDLATREIHTFIRKTSGEDQFPITLELELELRRWLASYEAECGPLHPDWFLFPNRERGKLGPGGTGIYGAMKPTERIKRAGNIVSKVFAAAGYSVVGEHEGAHTIRRSTARVLFDSLKGAEGGDHALRIVSATLHHKHSQTTEGYLGLSTEKAMRDAVLKGRSFLGASVTAGNVIPLRPVGGDAA